ncbi:tubby-like F-box protein 3 isoform X3 [Hevea brasiliensis]|uniref:tubby-like F-box protein 3 isoform X3 n=1 Tax=Hevea brasiliensis TaxID=3981 RepID=UPI000B797C70|nr:tubby-like F-box protein 3 isoform X3 [Hevea brasiliensis]
MSTIRCMTIRSRSHRVVQDGSLPALEVEEWHGGDTSCWANMPQELLREVLLRIEASESSWPPRKSVVACAGVCRTWRHITKDLVKVPELSGRLTFPISVKQPGPRDFLLQCFIKRCRSTQTYYLYLSLTNALAEDGKFLLAARKCRRPTFTDYIISLDADNVSKGSSSYVGKLRSNFLGTKFTVFDGQPPHTGAKMMKSRSTKLVNLKQVSPRVPAGNYPVAHISYELNVLGSRGPRRMQCIMDAIPSTSIEPGPLPSQKDGALVLKNKAPRWHEQLHCWCLNFHGRVTIASVKNFQLVASPENGPAGPEHQKIILQFGKVGKDLFTMDYRYPISAFQAFAICVSSFDTKIACE